MGIRVRMPSAMAFEFTIPHAFSGVSIRAHAPSTPGVYGISNSHQWIYTGTADNIRERLLERLIEPSAGLKRYTPTGFSFEVCDSRTKSAHHTRLVAQYDPAYNREARLVPGRNT